MEDEEVTLINDKGLLKMTLEDGHCEWTSKSSQNQGSDEARLSSKVAHVSSRIMEVEQKLKFSFWLELAMFAALLLLTIVLFGSLFGVHSHDVNNPPLGLDMPKELKDQNRNQTPGSSKEEVIEEELPVEITTQTELPTTTQKPIDYKALVKNIKFDYPASYSWEATIKKKTSTRSSYSSYRRYSYLDDDDDISSDIAVTSDLFPVKGYTNLSAQAKLTKREYQNIYVALAFKGDVNFTTIPEVKYQLKDLDGHVNHKAVSKNSPPRASLVYKDFNFNMSFRTILSSEMSKYQNDDKVTIDIYVEPPTQTTYSDDGVLLWKVEEFQKKKLAEESGEEPYQSSPYFYTHPKGYKVRARMYLDGFSFYQNDGITLSVVFVSGEYDDSLPVDCPFRANLTIFNQMDSSKHLTKSVDVNPMHRSVFNVFMGKVDPLTHGESFVRDDILYYKVQLQKISYN